MSGMHQMLREHTSVQQAESRLEKLADEGAADSGKVSWQVLKAIPSPSTSLTAPRSSCFLSNPTDVICCGSAAVHRRSKMDQQAPASFMHCPPSKTFETFPPNISPDYLVFKQKKATRGKLDHKAVARKDSF